MKAILLALPFLTLALNAKADGITLTPVVPLDCQQPQLKQVTFVQGTPAQAGDDSAITLNLTWGTCQKGQINLKPIGSDYNVYLVNQEYSSDFDYNVTTDGNSITIKMSLDPKVFFAQFDQRHFDLSYYPSGGPLSFNFHMLFTKDPVTGGARLMMTQF